jgi:hypothetical protein
VWVHQLRPSSATTAAAAVAAALRLLEAKKNCVK